MAIFCVWGGGLAIIWRRKILKALWFTLTVIAAALLLLPGRDVDAGALRHAYVEALADYEGTRYVWGGETGFGIDCSGFVRRGLVDANFNMGVTRFNPRQVRAAVWLWWRDCTAKAMGKEHRGMTRFLFEAPSINELDHSRILPGDLAVTKDGIHVLAYTGEMVWIQSTTIEMKVVKVKAPDASHRWFRVPVRLMRWTQLAGQK